MAATDQNNPWANGPINYNPNDPTNLQMLSQNMGGAGGMSVPQIGGAPTSSGNASSVITPGTNPWPTGPGSSPPPAASGPVTGSLSRQITPSPATNGMGGYATGTPVSVDNSGHWYNPANNQLLSTTPNVAGQSAPYQAPAPPPVTNGGYNDIPGLFRQIYSQTPTSPYQQQLNDAIMRTLQQNQAPVSAADPMLQAIAEQAQRSQDYNRQVLGERLYGQGIPASSGAWDNAVAGFNQQSQENTQNQIAGMIQQRQQNILQALSLGSQYLTAQQTQQLQAALAQLNSMLSNSQFYNQLGTQAGEFAANQNANAVNNL